MQGVEGSNGFVLNYVRLECVEEYQAMMIRGYWRQNLELGRESIPNIQA
jgi:hypothetical protein